MMGYGTPSNNRFQSGLYSNETLDTSVEAVSADSGQKFHGLLQLTNERIMFYSEGLFSERSMDFPLQSIVSIDIATKWISTEAQKIRILTKGKSVEFQCFSKEKGKEFVQRARWFIHQSQSLQPQIQYTQAAVNYCLPQPEKCFCTECGQQLPQDALFCMKCGTKTTMAVSIFCTKCGQQLPRDASFCIKCGASVLPNPEPAPE